MQSWGLSQTLPNLKHVLSPLTYLKIIIIFPVTLSSASNPPIDSVTHYHYPLLPGLPVLQVPLSLVC